MASMNNTLTRYKSLLPPDVIIAESKLRFAELQHANLGALVYPENGGYYLKFPEGKVVAIANDRLRSVIDENLERDGMQEEANETMEDLRKAGIDADRLKAEASDKIKSDGCVRDGDCEEDASNDFDGHACGQQPKAKS
ncbi:hypothetical protein TSTA_003810 [Talaromyces stipitatus ATCC 10500]|uniref:Uncharacterized protein n=1 Tax=Talaromyces stipitatus (strain ATCC 10500 / CBS 375.48 / QM 6759 / NRRL 1006) TaxID=441959 RepID=B8MSD7_TALSN|nr:uncharacterized protein TSTA_003810 [Talaromyces stipitatus ATCC 10500]XP_002487979.1 uncharacterized protein TSTA_003810 [Talaromyces stipitatus ATCC 10500]EED12324.1 hypothetical protein TSTA_003810 [Talaromyces stipitatus ATCC 10500]EED12325.1 hypothetical protein TSTA_003810 [Talaromyces stipitatus ATCC 10500]